VGEVHTCRWKAAWMRLEVKEAARGDGRQDGIGERMAVAIDHITLPSMVMRGLKPTLHMTELQILQAH
jgi:hypothetical protein